MPCEFKEVDWAALEWKWTCSFSTNRANKVLLYVFACKCLRKTTTRGCFETCAADDMLQTTNNTNSEWPLKASSCITPFGRTATREMITACWYHHSPLAKRQLGIMMVENGSATHIQPLAERQLGMKLVYANQLGNSHGTTTNISKNDQICLYI